jgi:NADH:ubiquinone oxidoreductase subunit 5 (subunit L)/multisubunit Na+/H+ antiporter MnhA subunit
MLPLLLGLAWLLPLCSFAAILFFGPRMGKGGRGAAYLATGAIVLAFALSLTAHVCWLMEHPLSGPEASAAEGADPAIVGNRVAAVTGDWYSLAEFGPLNISIGYYIDSLTIAMFVMVTLVASCIHVYSFGYMHEELHEVTDPLVAGPDGLPLRRRGRFHRFFQYLSLFCFSMLGLVIAGNVAMVFGFWELVGICSYLLIGFYRERRSASNAANKAFIVNRIGDFGMIIGLMAVWTGFGTFSFGDVKNENGLVVQPGIFNQIRPEKNHYELTVPDGMVKLSARAEVAEIVKNAGDMKQAREQIAAKMPDWRDKQHYGYWLLVIAGLGIFCGCVGKSAQFPLFVWLPDAMEGPTPVSALIHAATMVAAGVYLAGRFYPVFAPEVLLAIAYIGCITLFIAATIALAATDIKRVLAYSTVSQLGYMMLALGVGGWLAGMLHLFTHAFFKSLLFLCSGSVIHACGTNEMPSMGGLRKKMPWTAYTMLIGCLAISGAGIPGIIGLSGYYSKDYILAQALAFNKENSMHPWLLYLATVGAGLTAFYMFRLWYMTFAGKPRDYHVYDHAHESPNSMVIPLCLLAVMAVVAAWNIPVPVKLGLEPLLDQSRPLTSAEGARGGVLLQNLVVPPEHSEAAAHAEHSSKATELAAQSAEPESPLMDTHVRATLIAFVVALLGFLLATFFYGLRRLDPEDAKRQFAPVYRFLVHKWWFDELYDYLFVRPVMRLASGVAALDKKGIDWLADNSARVVAFGAVLDDWFDRTFVDASVNLVARWTHAVGLRLRAIQTGDLHQYIVFLVVGTVTLFVLLSMYWSFTIPGV